MAWYLLDQGTVLGYFKDTRRMFDPLGAGPMIDHDRISELAERIAREFHPRQIILFGSSALGNATEDSDIDLLVIMPTGGSGLRKAAEIMNQISPRVPVDLIVRDPEDVQRRLEANDFFLREVVEKGKILYESTDD
jgi:predicted nucleotidyltransferase